MSHEEDHVVSGLATLCREYGIKCLVQVGADDGYEADIVRSRVGCEAITIEALPSTASISPLHNHYAVIGATNCETTFYHAFESRELSSLFSRPDIPQVATVVQMQRLDTFCEERGIKPDALIIDVEGATMDVLEGADRILGYVRLIYAEVPFCEMRPGIRTLPEIEALLSARGFAKREGSPAYSVGSQGNMTWVRP